MIFDQLSSRRGERDQAANSRFAARTLNGLRHAVEADPGLADSLFPIAGRHLDHHRRVARDAAKRLIQAIENI